MGKRLSRIVDIEEEQGQPLDVLIPTLLQELGSQKSVASHLRISEASLSTWLKENGYQARTVWEKAKNEPAA